MPSTYPYHQLYRSIKHSQYGQILSQNVRFGRFKPESLQNSTWEQILGADVNNLKHMWFTKKLTDKFLVHSPRNQFSPREIHLLRLTATFHDLAESVVGDIPKVSKTGTDELEEKAVLIQIIDEMSQIDEAFNAAKSDILYSIEHILFPASPTPLSQTFSAIEYLGYLHTACVAKNASEMRLPHHPTAVQLASLAAEVIKNSLVTLQPLFSKYPGAARLISQTAPYRDTLSLVNKRISDHDYFQNLCPTL